MKELSRMTLWGSLSPFMSFIWRRKSETEESRQAIFVISYHYSNNLECLLRAFLLTFLALVELSCSDNKSK